MRECDAIATEYTRTDLVPGKNDFVPGLVAANSIRSLRLEKVDLFYVLGHWEQIRPDMLFDFPKRPQQLWILR